MPRKSNAVADCKIKTRLPKAAKSQKRSQILLEKAESAGILRFFQQMDVIFSAKLADGEKADDSRQDADSDIADRHNDSHTDASKRGKLLKGPEHRNPESEYPAEINQQCIVGFPKPIEHSYYCRIDAQRNSTPCFKPVNRHNKILKSRIILGKQPGNLPQKHQV